MLFPKRTRRALLCAFALCCSVLFVSQAQAQETAAANAPSGKVSICKEIDDDWKCVGQASEWEADKPFNVLFENKGPVGVDFIGIVFYKQGADGKDVEHVNEYQQQIGETNSKYATVGDELKLPAGTYSVYVISWGKRELMMKNGNLKDYFAKTVLTVK
ncbi:MAG TPA: hypothetical protein VJT74_00350 [Pyrinomonadaceae bacterium]|nr:hypothetical protein [Pyrinomonadaceae bacterium]